MNDPLVSISYNNAIDANFTADLSQQIGKLPFERPLPSDEFIDTDLNVPTLRPMEFDEIIDFVVHLSATIAPNEKVNMRMKNQVNRFLGKRL